MFWQSVLQVFKVFLWSKNFLKQQFTAHTVAVAKGFQRSHLFGIKCSSFHKFALNKFRSRQSFFWVNFEAKTNEAFQLIGVLHWNSFVDPTDNCLFQRFKIMTYKGRLQSRHLIQNTSQRPNIAFSTVRFLLPNLGACVIWSSSLSTGHPVGSNNGYIHICKLYLRLVFGKENVGRFDISVENIHIMKGLQPLQRLISHPPDCSLIDILLHHLVLVDHLEDIASFQALGDYAKAIGQFIEE